MKKVKFSFLELFLSIICIIIISLIIIPFVSNIFITTEKKVFIEFTDIVNTKTIEKYKSSDEDTNECYVYDITKDLDLGKLGSFKGYSIVKDGEVYISIHNKDYMVSNMNYINKKTTDNYMVDYNSKEIDLTDFLSDLECKNNEY